MTASTHDAGCDRHRQLRRRGSLVAVNVVSERVDVPRLVLAAQGMVKRSDLFFCPAIGRVVRRPAVVVLLTGLRRPPSRPQ
jgi:superfamily II DNA or RNA helicase